MHSQCFDSIPKNAKLWARMCNFCATLGMTSNSWQANVKTENLSWSVHLDTPTKLSAVVSKSFMSQNL